MVVSGDISWDDPPPPRPRAWQQFWRRPIQACQAHPGPSRHVRPEQFWLQARLGFMWENASSSIVCCHHWSFNSCLLLRNHPLTLRVPTGSGQWEKLITALLSTSAWFCCMLIKIWVNCGLQQFESPATVSLLNLELKSNKHFQHCNALIEMVSQHWVGERLDAS